MHFGFALDLSDIDLWNIDYLAKYLDLLDTDTAFPLISAESQISTAL